MYFRDLSPYEYLACDANRDVLCVGWLDAEHEFLKGPLPALALTRVLALCFKPVNQTRGFHQSPFRKASDLGYSVEYKAQTMLLGSAEIRVPDKRTSKLYAAPNPIYHYMKDCGYLPPLEFLEALQSVEVE